MYLPMFASRATAKSAIDHHRRRRRIISIVVIIIIIIITIIIIIIIIMMLSRQVYVWKCVSLIMSILFATHFTSSFQKSGSGKEVPWQVLLCWMDGPWALCSLGRMRLHLVALQVSLFVVEESKERGIYDWSVAWWGKMSSMTSSNGELEFMFQDMTCRPATITTSFWIGGHGTELMKPEISGWE